MKCSRGWERRWISATGTFGNATTPPTLTGRWRFCAGTVSAMSTWAPTSASTTPAGLDKFDALALQGLLRVAYDREGARIYEVVGAE